MASLLFSSWLSFPRGREGPRRFSWKPATQCRLRGGAVVSRVGTRPSQGPHRPCGRRVAAGPSAGSSQHSLRPRGLRESGASASCGFSTWWWPAPGRMQEESPLPVQAVLSTSPSPPSQGQTKTYQTFGLEGAVPPPPLPLLTGGRTPSSSCSHRHWRFIWEMQRGGSPQVWRLLSAPRTAVVLRSSSLLLEHPSPSPGPLAS